MLDHELDQQGKADRDCSTDEELYLQEAAKRGDFVGTRKPLGAEVSMPCDSSRVLGGPSPAEEVFTKDCFPLPRKHSGASKTPVCWRVL